MYLDTKKGNGNKPTNNKKDKFNICCPKRMEKQTC